MLWVAVLVVAGLLTACGSFEMPLPRFDFLRRQPASTTPGDPAPLTFLVAQSSPAEEELLRRWVAAYTQARPHVQIDLQFASDYEAALQAAISGDAVPDIFLVNAFFLPDLIAADRIARTPAPSAYVADLVPALSPAFLDGNDLACFPRDANTLALYYNRARFDKAEIPYPHAAWTWQEMQDAAAALTDINNGLYGFVLNPDMSRWLPFFYAAGGQWLPETSSTTFTGAAATSSLEYYFNLFWEGYAIDPVPLNSTWPGEAFGRGAVGMTIEGPWLIPYLAEHFPDIEYGIVELPAGSAGRATVAFASCYAVSAKASNLAAALEFAGMLAHPDNLTAWAETTGSLPPLRSLGPAWIASHPDKSLFLTSMDYAHLWQFAPGYTQVVNSFNSSLTSAIAGESTVQEALERTQAAVNSLPKAD